MLDRASTPATDEPIRNKKNNQNLQNNQLIMKLFTLATGMIASVSALAGQLSNVQNQRLQFDLAERMEHRRLILDTVRKINRMPVRRRAAAMRGLQKIVRKLGAAYGYEPTAQTIKNNKTKYKKATRRKFYKKHPFNIISTRPQT